MDQQLNLFNYGLERKQITKKTRLIEIINNYLGEKYENWKEILLGTIRYY